MSYEKEFMKEFEEWIKTQVMINEMALEESKKVFDEDQDERAKIAMIRYEAVWTLISSCKGSLKISMLEKDFMIYQMASLVKENIKNTILKAFN